MRTLEITTRRFTLLLGLAVVGPACAPTPQEGAKLQTLTGVTATGDEAAFAFVAVVNDVVRLGSSKTSDVARAKQLVEAPYLAPVLCTSKSAMKAEEMIDLLRLHSFAGDLFVTPRRDLLITNPAGKPETISRKLCTIWGGRLLTYPVLDEVLTEVTGLPDELPSQPEVRRHAEDSYVLAQAIYLAMRGPYNRKAKRYGSTIAGKLIEMARVHSFVRLTPAALLARFEAADAVYNPCLNAPLTRRRYFAGWRQENFACVVSKTSAELSVYRAGGLSGARFTEVTDRIAAKLADAHDRIFEGSGGRPLLELWEMLTSGRSFEDYKEGPLRELAQLLSRRDEDAAEDLAAWIGRKRP
jgi:hypothetical protein